MITKSPRVNIKHMMSDHASPMDEITTNQPERKAEKPKNVTLLPRDPGPSWMKDVPVDNVKKRVKTIEKAKEAKGRKPLRRIKKKGEDTKATSGLEALILSMKSEMRERFDAIDDKLEEQQDKMETLEDKVILYTKISN